ncbi:MAG: hypothetical protein NZT61_00675 [Deltaproteobacteria bacterium]|nr:hypothetical protein [Deltaproteobacteria bacterium]MCX7952993.1 hypothetical protein [Deltaproteobacteria bacterium]
MINQFVIIDDDRSFSFILETLIKKLVGSPKIVSLYSVNESKDFFEKLDDKTTAGKTVVFLDENLGDGLGSELIESGLLNNFYVISMSSDDSPAIAFRTLSNGAVYFIPKREVSQTSFKLFLLGLLTSLEVRQRQKEFEIFYNNLVLARKILNNLQHEINNPLAAVLGSLNLAFQASLTSEEKDRICTILKSSLEKLKKYLHELRQIIDAGQFDKIVNVS